jgi:hypothetical protein
LHTFRLTDAAFIALAAGRPSPATVAVLRDAQVSRHLLLLTEIRHRSGKIPRWYAESVAKPLEPTTHDRATDGPADPMCALHTAATLAALRSGADPPPDRIASARHLTAAHDGLTLRVRLEDTDPLRARLGLTPFRQLTDDEAAEWQTRLTAAWRILVTRHRDAAETMAAVLSVLVPLAPTSAGVGISATSPDAYGAVAISPPADARSLAVGLLHETQHSVLNAVRTLFDLVAGPATPQYSPWRDDPRPPFGILHGAYAYQAVTRFWRTECALHSTQPRAEQPRAEQPRAEQPAEQPGGEQPAEQPGGEQAGDHARGDGPDGRLAAFEFARWRAAVVAAADGLLAGGGLTAAGERFVGAMRDEVARWLGDPVEPEVARLAAGANAEHRARWRLRNLLVAPETVEAVVAAWRAGLPPPAVPVPAVRAGSGRALERSERLDLVHRMLRRPSEGQGTGSSTAPQTPSVGRGTDTSTAPRGPGDPGRRPGRPGDDAYLGGDHGTALRAYLEELDRRRTHPAPYPALRDLDLWAGLAVVSPDPALRERPELVRAVYLALHEAGARGPEVAAGGPDLRRLAGWLE